MLITEEHRKQYEQLHVERENFGKNSHMFVDAVFHLCGEHDTTDVLDYGCGKGVLNLCLPFHVKQYDPGIKKHSKEPEPADIVVCTDVLEHIEPECLDDVLAHLKTKIKKIALIHVPGVPAKRHLPDGRNAHLIVEEPEWWEEKLSSAGFEILDKEYSVYKNPQGRGLFAIVK